MFFVLSGFLLSLPFWKALDAGENLPSLIVGRLLENKVTSYIAQVSFGVYVWHYLVLELVRELWMPLMAR